MAYCPHCGSKSGIVIGDQVHCAVGCQRERKEKRPSTESAVSFGHLDLSESGGRSTSYEPNDGCPEGVES